MDKESISLQSFAQQIAHKGPRVGGVEVFRV